MAKIIRLISAVAVAGLVTSCSGAQPEDPETSSPAVEVEESPSPTEEVNPEIEAAKQAYNEVLDNIDPAEFTVNADYALIGEYSYSVVEMTGDDVPELLVQAEDSNGLFPVKVYTMRDGEAFSPRETLLNAAASAGGYRATLLSFEDGNQIAQVEGQSGTGEATAQGFTIEDDSIVKTDWTWSGMLTDDIQDTYPIQYLDIDDRSALEILDDPTTFPGRDLLKEDPSEQATPDTSASSGGKVVTGTVRVFTEPELVAYEGREYRPTYGESCTVR